MKQAKRPSRLLQKILLDCAAQMAVEGFEFYMFDCGDDIAVLHGKEAASIWGSNIDGREYVQTAFHAPVKVSYVNSADELAQDPNVMR